MAAEADVCVGGADCGVCGWTGCRHLPQAELCFVSWPDADESRKGNYLCAKTKKIYAILLYYYDYSSMLLFFFLLPVCFLELLRPNKKKKPGIATSEVNFEQDSDWMGGRAELELRSVLQ